ncbi:MAG: type I-D CRISPR-associated protein Cas5/Csc1 [Deltaproteobacteria bacterium]|nr:type I-D CRISPR-associated protein Cas5/Csc1 [Deltaproteobacteria bacterium]
MQIYRCQLTLLEATFFSSREVSNTYYTEPCIGNIALAYALHLCQSPYFNDGAIHYKTHLSQLNEQGIYVTPATIDAPQFTLSQFNAQPDAYWYAMANNTIVTRPDETWTEKRGAAWYVIKGRGDRGKKVGLENRPQHGRIRALSIGNEALFFILSRQPLAIPNYIRLGKFMSKARIKVTKHKANVIEKEAITIQSLLNPADLSPQTALTVFDLIAIPPTPLIRNARLSGEFYQLPNKQFLPVGMRFGVENLPD